MQNQLTTAQVLWHDMIGLTHAFDFAPPASRENAALFYGTPPAIRPFFCRCRWVKRAVVRGTKTFFANDPMAYRLAR
jgi:hypothetical protein